MKNYKTFMLSDEPKIFGIQITSGLPVFLLTAIGLCTGYAPQLFIVGAVLSFIMSWCFGGLPIKYFYSVLYWYLPKKVTCVMFKGSPDSANRVYMR